MGERADVDAAAEGSGGKSKDAGSTQSNLAAWTELTDAGAAAGAGGDGGGSGSGDAGKQAGTDAGKGVDAAPGGAAAASGAGYLTVELRAPKVGCQLPPTVAPCCCRPCCSAAGSSPACHTGPAALRCSTGPGYSPHCPPPLFEPLPCLSPHAATACLTLLLLPPPALPRRRRPPPTTAGCWQKTCCCSTPGPCSSSWSRFTLAWGWRLQRGAASPCRRQAPAHRLHTTTALRQSCIASRLPLATPACLLANCPASHLPLPTPHPQLSCFCQNGESALPRCRRPDAKDLTFPVDCPEAEVLAPLGQFSADPAQRGTPLDVQPASYAQAALKDKVGRAGLGVRGVGGRGGGRAAGRRVRM